jgi:serine protease AprX
MIQQMKYTSSSLFTFFIGVGFFLISPSLSAQFTRHIVWLKNKGNNSYTLASPDSYLSSRAIARRNRYTIALDSTDLPITASYLTQIKNVLGVTVLNTSKWLNAVCIQTADAAALATIQTFPFVQQVAGLAARTAPQEKTQIDKFTREEALPAGALITTPLNKLAGDYYNYGGSATAEIKLHRGEFLHNIGLRGAGMHVAVLDGGFYNFNTLPAFDSINRNGQVLSTWDFVSRNAAVQDDHPHGMQCLSTIAANIPGQFVGKAPQASFHLFRTEDVNSEYPIEEFNWVCGAERADSAGSDIISSSLGYFDFDNPVFNYTYQQMNGRTTICVKGADLAAKKGILVFNSAGNEGNTAWRYIITPADGDSVVAVGAVNVLGAVGAFSSYGPSGDGRIKPELASVGVSAVVQTTGGGIGVANGTSFACPNLAGLATCLWQGFPEFNNMKIIDALKRSGNRYTSPNDRIGYGIPDCKNAFAQLVADYATCSVSLTNCEASLSWKSKDVAGMQYIIERKLPTETSYRILNQSTVTSGAVLANKTYTYQDPLQGISTGTIQYRISQIIDTASASKQVVYLDSTTLAWTTACPTPTASPLFIIYPNPTVGNNKINFKVNTLLAIADLQITCHDATGKLVGRYSFSKPAGSFSGTLPIKPNLSGVYILALQAGDTVLATKEWVVTN